MTKKLNEAERKRRKAVRKHERTRRNEYINGLVTAALKERSSGQLADPPYPPPRRSHARPQIDKDAHKWPDGDVRMTPSVLNQFHPDFDWRAALRYYAIIGGRAGRGFVEYVMAPDFDRTLFGSHANGFKDALVALNALVEWCRDVALPPIFEVISPANAERFIQDRIKAGIALRTLDNRRGIYAALWDSWSERGEAYAESMQGACEPIENPWRQPEVAPAKVAKRTKNRKTSAPRPPTSPRVVSEAQLAALAEGRKQIAIRTNEHHARIERRVKVLKAKGIVSNKRMADELNNRGALGQRDGRQDATSIRRHLEHTARWSRRGSSPP